MIDNEKNSQTRYPYFQVGALSIQYLTPEKKNLSERVEK